MYQTLPSEIYRVTDDPLAAAYFDRAVAFFGARVQGEIDEATKDKSGARAVMASNMVMARWVVEPGGKPAGAKFRSPTPARG